ncbi:hypothetical protein [Metabacillus malikii]|uniref:DUF3899 domain-containing protein n=1 Tax=Metabacillus malikii TaxID=1504265 RepID=A0ABT9ZD73_9BACI|nr:hypothetical protein [Metabacillus malikii]MDQ0229533.1 hypothetical protein [Metabacillus malikii]
MSHFSTILLGLAVVIAVISLIYTFRVGRDISARRAKYDGPIDEKVQEHPYIRNPIFLACLIAGIFSLAYIFYLAYTISW